MSAIVNGDGDGNPAKQINSSAIIEDVVAKEVEEGELPEEGEITDDDEGEDNKNQAENKPQQTPQVQQQNSGSNNRQQQHQGSENRRDYHKGTGGGRDGGGASWRKPAFGGHHQPFNKGGGGKFTPNNRGGEGTPGGRYRDIDGRMAMKTNAQQEEEMLDSWVRGVNRKNRQQTSPNRGDISPIRTSPMIEPSTPPPMIPPVKVESSEQPPSTFMSAGIKREIKKEAEMTAAAAPPLLDDDMDFRGTSASGAGENAEQQGGRQSPSHSTADDVDFRRSALPAEQPHQPFIGGGHHSPPIGEPATRFEHGDNRRRPRSQSPPSAFGEQRSDFYGSEAKRHRPFLHDEGPPGRPMGDGIKEEGAFTPDRGGFPFDQGPPPPFHDGDDHHGPWGRFDSGGGGFQNNRGGRGGTAGWGYRGGRPFFPRLICKFFREGFCRDAEKCTFSHATADSHRQPQLCRFYQQGFCKKALFCQLMHGEWPCKAFHKGECTKEPCQFSHKELDDVSRPIVEKMMEDERLGIIGPDQQQNQPQQQQPGTPYFPHQQRGGGFYRPRFQHHQHQGGGGGPGPGGGQQFHPGHHGGFQHHPHPPPPQQFQQPPGYPPPVSAAHGEPPPFGQPPQQQHFMGAGPSPPEGIIQQQQPLHPDFQQGQGGQPGAGGPPNIPPPGLVVPPMLGGPPAGGAGTPSSTAATGPGPHPFGFFNPVAGGGSGQQPPSHLSPQQFHQPQPQPSFQQLQQQVQQQGTMPHFPHQPSLLGPPMVGVGQGGGGTPTQQQIMAANLQQQMMGSPFKQEFGGTTAPPPATIKQEQQQEDVKPEKVESSSGGFNINQMLEQITRQQSPPPSSPTTKTFADPTMDLFASVGLGEMISEESPASPTIGGAEGDKPAALIPITCEWKLHPVDIPAREDPDVQFDMKFIQQISTSNSDPRLRKLAERQFDLVSRTLEKEQQASQQQKGGGEEDVKPSKAELLKVKTERGESPSTSPQKVVVTADPRKDPRRKSKEISSTKSASADQLTRSSQLIFLKSDEQMTTADYGAVASISTPSTNATADEEFVQRQMAALMAQQHQQQLGRQQPAIGPFGEMLQMPPPNFSTPPPFTTGAPIQVQHQQQHQQLPPPHSMSIPPPPAFFSSPPPPFVVSVTIAQHQQPSNTPFLSPTHQQQQPQFQQVPPPGAPLPAHHPHQQLLGAHAFNVGGYGGGGTGAANKSPPSTTSMMGGGGGGGGYNRGRRGGDSGGPGRHHQQPQQHQRPQPGSPKITQHQQDTLLPPPIATSAGVSLREKRKNNEYDSPLARMASGNRQ